MLKGVVGYVRWRLYTAAQLEGYVVTPDNKQGTAWTLSATIVLQNDFNLAQTPLTFVAKHKQGEWKFPILSHEVRTDTHQLTARLGPPA